MSNANKAFQVKNRAPAPIQISAEQILREAADRVEAVLPEPAVKIHDAEEYQLHLRDRRKHFEDNIRYRREHVGTWVKYARFEEDNSELERARSIYERALEVECRSAELYLRYAEMEMRHESINHARNILDRAVQLLPRVDFLWYKYVYMEDMVGDRAKVRAVFERWMQWIPDDNAWFSYSRFETRQGRLEAAEQILRRYVNTYPSARAFLRFAKWAEFEAKNIDLARTIYESALQELEPEEWKQARVFRQFAAFEERQQELERARVLYRHAIQLFGLEQLKRSNDKGGRDDDDISDYERTKRQELYQAYLNFEKKHGNRQRIEDVVLTSRRQHYQQAVAADPYDYDGWLEYAKLEQAHAAESRSYSTNSLMDSAATAATAAVREVYERAVAQVPPTSDNKDHWRRYIYLWIYYAVYEELDNGDLARASQIYEACLRVIPHSQFSFAKIWVLAAQVDVRRKDLTAARKLLGRAIGMCGKERIFVEYIALETALGEMDRCRTLYEQYIKAMPYNGKAWSQFATLETSVGETERARAIYELAVQQPALDMPELLWKAYIDFEIDQGSSDNARGLYKRLLERTTHVKVWISLAQFEASPIGKGMEEARRVLDQAYQQLKQEQLSEERVLLLDAWRALEKRHGDADTISAVEAKMPRRIKRRRMRHDEDGRDIGWEEYFDYQFPDDNQAAAGNLKILEMAARWKQQQQEQDDDHDDDEEEEEEMDHSERD